MLSKHVADVGVIRVGSLKVRAFIAFFDKYRKVVHFFHAEFDLEHFKHKGPYYKKASDTVHLVSHVYGHLMAGMMVLGMFLYNALPVYHNYRKGVFSDTMAENETYDFSVYYTFPGIVQDDHFWFYTIANVWLSYTCSVLICMFDCYMAFMVFHMIGHIKVLVYNLGHFERPKAQHLIKQNGIQVTVDLYDDNENEIVHRKIVECIHHHRFIAEFVNDVSTLFGPMLACTYLFHLISCCLLLLECSQMDPDILAQYGPLTVIIFGQLIQISVLFEVLGTESEKIKDVVYCMPWECMNIRNQRSLCIFLQRVQIPITISALGLTAVGVQTMAGILKTTFSYFAFLRSII